MMIQSKAALALTFLVAVIVAALTLAPISVPAPVENSDKIYHILAFAALAFPISLFRPDWLLFAILVFAVFGGAIEIIQPYVGRECNLSDWIADLVGIAIGVSFGRAAAAVVPSPPGP